MQHMNIGEAAATAGVTPKMVRHYETLGLVPEPDRTDAGYRLYGEREIAMLRFIRQSRTLGFSMQQIAELMALWRNEGRQSAQVKQVAILQLQALEERQRELDQMRATLDQLVRECRGDEQAHCAILEQLAASATPAAAPAGLGRARRALKDVRIGEKQPARAARTRHQETASHGHAALSAWMHGFGQA